MAQSKQEPVTVVTVDNDERKTVELCADENRGRRCMKRRGHDGEHEWHAVQLFHTWT